VKALAVVLAIVGAFLIQTLGGRYFWPIRSYLDLFLVTAATFGLIQGRQVGMFAGAAAGLVQDAFSGGLLGLNGASKTTMGYLAGIAGHRLVVRGWAGRFVFFALATAADLAILAVIGQVLERPTVVGGPTDLLYLCAANGAMGALILAALDRFTVRR
jgi:rod shape-determining protein MreD